MYLHALSTALPPRGYTQVECWEIVQRSEMRDRLVQTAPATLAGESVVKVDTLDGVKFKLADGGWLLIRPSGTEPVLRIYAEAPTADAVSALLEAGAAMGHSVVNGE